MRSARLNLAGIAIARLTRPQRAEVSLIVQQLKSLPLEQRADVVERLPEWQRDLIERCL